MMRAWVLVILLGFVLLAHGQDGRTAEGKLAPELFAKLQVLNAKESVCVSVSVKPGGTLNAKAFGLQPAHSSATVYRSYLPKQSLLLLAAQADVLFINEQRQPVEELNTGAVDYTLNKINKAHLLYPTVTGDSVFAVVKERAFDSADIDLKGRVFSTGLRAALQTSHASLMATIVAGAGNSSPFAKGVAPGVSTGSVDFANLFPESDAFYAQKKVSVVNHSYGTVVENFYGTEAMAYDVNASNNPTLLHVFSAGNLGTAAPTLGTYNGLAGAANITGNFKQSKNTISVAALDSAGVPMSAASKGPAYDGRLKPELSAYGEDGSSGAAALVSGAAALVQDAFKKRNGSWPSSDLVKAVLINSADDVGTTGIDYATGYGSLNAQKAIETVLQARLFQNSVTQGELKTFSLPVPSNVAKLKVTIAWKDAAATAGATKALVNDLDLQLRLPSANTTWLPWVLNPSPNFPSLQAAALRKTDTLNVVEQITVDNPSAGSYTIEVKGTKLSTGSQSFAVAYQFDTAGVFHWTFPTANDPLVAGRTQWLRWQTTLSGAGQIEYATAGNNWRTVGNVSDVGTSYFKWLVPDTIATAVLRIRHLASGGIVLSDTFVVSPLLNVQTGFNCNDSFLLYWKALPLSAYRVFELSGNYLQPFAQQSDTSLLLRTAQHPSTYYAVAPVVNGKEGLRSQTINYASQGVGCYVKSFFLQTQTASAVFFTAEIGSLFNVQEVALEKSGATGFTTVQTFVSPTALLFSFSDSSLTQGENRYRFRVKLKNGVVLYSNAETVYALPASPVVLYPNPVQQNASLTVLAKEVGRYSLQVFDANGRLVHTQTLNSSVSRLAAATLPKGLYLIRVVDAQGKPFTQKLVVF